MRYLLLCCVNEQLWNDLPESRRGEVMRDYGALIRSLDASGHHLPECRDMDEAIAIAMRIPTPPCGGTVEVRPLLQP